MIQFQKIAPPTGYTAPVNQVLTEYPKWVHFDGTSKPSVLVDTPGEEQTVLNGGKAPEPKQAPAQFPDAPIKALVGENDEKEMLLKIADEKGIRVDGRWKLTKLRSAVEAQSPPMERG